MVYSTLWPILHEKHFTNKPYLLISRFYTLFYSQINNSTEPVPQKYEGTVMQMHQSKFAQTHSLWGSTGCKVAYYEPNKTQGSRPNSYLTKPFSWFTAGVSHRSASSTVWWDSLPHRKSWHASFASWRREWSSCCTGTRPRDYSAFYASLTELSRRILIKPRSRHVFIFLPSPEIKRKCSASYRMNESWI